MYFRSELSGWVKKDWVLSFDVLLSEIENFQFQPLAIYDTLSIFLTSNIEMQTKIEGHIL